MRLLRSSGGTPIAASTWLGATLPDEQAEPEDTATPSRSRRDDQRFGRNPVDRDAKRLRQPRRAARRRRSAVPGVADDACKPVAPARPDRRPSPDRPSAAVAAAPKPAIAATFSVPARRPLLLAAAGEERREGEVLARPHDRAGALRPADLVGGQGQHVDAERGDVDRDAARRLDRVGVDDGAGFVREPRATAATGWITPVSLLASITETSGRARPGGFGQAGLQRVEIDHPVAVDRERVARLGREPAAGQHRRMLGGADEETPIRRGLPATSNPAVSTVALASVPPLVKVTSFGDRRRPAAHDRRGRASIRPRAARALGVHRRGVADRAQRLDHRRARLRPQRRAGVVVEIDTLRDHAGRPPAGPSGMESLKSAPAIVI